MCAVRQNKSALARRIRDLAKELDAVNAEIKGLSKVVRKAEHAGVSAVLPPAAAPKNAEPEKAINVQQESRMPVSVLAKQSIEYSQPRSQADNSAKRSVTDKDQITRDGRFATYLMSRDFHNVRPLRHERHIQRNKAIVMVVIVVFFLLYLLLRFMP